MLEGLVQQDVPDAFHGKAVNRDTSRFQRYCSPGKFRCHSPVPAGGRGSSRVQTDLARLSKCAANKALADQGRLTTDD
jgi:hypothetical protein